MSRRSQIAMYTAAAVLGAVDFAAPFLGRSTVSQASVLIGLHPPHVGRVAVHVIAREAFIVAGILAISRRPSNRVGYLMATVGVVWMLPDIGFVQSSLAYTLSELFTGMQWVFLAYLALAFPTGRLASRADRLVMSVGYVFAIANAIGSLPFYNPHVSCPPCPANLILIKHDPSLAHVLSQIDGAIGVAFAIVGGVRLIEHWRTASLRGRRALTPVFVALIPVVAVAIWDGVSTLPLPGLSDLAVGALPICFLVGLLRARLDRFVVGDLVVQLGAGLSGTSLRNALARSLRDPTFELAYWLPDRQTYVDPDGRPIDVPEEGNDRVATVIEGNGEPLAALIFDASLRDESELVSSVGAAAKLTLENERLQAEVKAQLQEVRASRARIVTSADAERRRLERDLHDGAQQRLVNLSLALRLAQEQAGGERNGELAATLAEAADEIRLALSELRELARGLHPTILTEAGLGSALESLAERSPVSTMVEASLAERLPSSVEATAYFVVSEALANVAKHAKARSVCVRARLEEARLVLEVSDDGVGGADPAGGSGLRGLADRVAALDGTFRVESTAGSGTRVIAEIPCASS